MEEGRTDREVVRKADGEEGTAKVKVEKMTKCMGEGKTEHEGESKTEHEGEGKTVHK